MLGTLSKSQIEYLLASQIVGRIGCHLNGKIYVVPINYAFQGKYIYSHTVEGLKLTMMRQNPQVCVEVDEIESFSNWRSVIAWGIFEELKEKKARDKGMKIIKDRLSPYLTHEASSSKQHSFPPFVVEKSTQTTIYRIRITESTGRFEKPV